MAIFLKTNNLINIRYNSSNHWKGQKGYYQGYVVFDTVESCIRCGCKLLLNYMCYHHLTSVQAIVERFAPSSENNTNVYIKNVCLFSGFKPHEELNVFDVPRLLKAIIKQESSVDFPLQYIIDIYDYKTGL